MNSKILLILFVLFIGCAPQQAEFPEFQANTDTSELSAAEALNVSSSDSVSVMLVDVRSEKEFNEGHLPGAFWGPITGIEENARAWFPDTSRILLVYCHSGFRSRMATQTLRDMGYNAVNIKGGIVALKAAGAHLVQGKE